MFAKVQIDNEIELPHFPEEIDRDDMAWQSKQGLDVYSGPYRITADGRCEKKRFSSRDKTDEEKQAEAERWGFDSWEEMEQVYDEDDSDSIYPNGVDYDLDEDGYEETPPLFLSEQTTDEEWWADISYHGTFEFHQLIKRDHALEVFLEYEARFDKGDLTDVVFMGERHTNTDDPIGKALDKIEEWREWKASNASSLNNGDSK
jgi:hypothetical protein